MTDQDRLYDLTLRQAPLLNSLIAKAGANNRESLIVRILETPDPRLTASRIEELLELDKQSLIAELAQRLDRWKFFVMAIGGSSFLFATVKRSLELIRYIFVEGRCNQRKTLIEKLKELQDRVDFSESFSMVELSRELRRYKEQEFLRIGSRDLAGAADVVEVMAELSDLAMASLEVALDCSFKSLVAKHGLPAGLFPGSKGLVILSMGKLSGHELNFSSDIDLIYLRDPEDGWTSGPDRVAVSKFYELLSRLVSKAMSDVTEDGFVFRVDLRLRPEGEKGELVPSLRNAVEYYLSWGRTWERAALMKASPIAGDLKLGDEFLQEIEPFVYRKHLDYSTLDDMRSMKKQIETQLKKRPGLNIKLGQGGIREIEFFVQTLQLINGGKNKKLRSPSTLKALDLLSEGGILAEPTARGLRDAYLFFRTVEHRIQINHQLQTHDLPISSEERNDLARRMGYLDASALDQFLEDLDKRRKLVEDLFSSLFYHSSDDDVGQFSSLTNHLMESLEDHAKTVAILTDLGFRNPSSAYPLLKRLVYPATGGLISEKTRDLLERLAPIFIDELLKAPEPEKALLALDTYVESLQSAPNYYSTFFENPATVSFLIRILGESRFFTDLLIRHPDSIDSLIGNGLQSVEMGFHALQNDIVERLNYTGTLEEKLDVLRRFKNEKSLLIGVKQLTGEIDSPVARRLISQLADVCLLVAVEIAHSEMKRRFGSEGLEHPLPFVVVGMGKLGGMEMTYLSDLDVIFVFDSPNEHVGKLSSREWFTRLANRMISILSVPTSEGVAYSIDTRLRPSGNKGALVSTLKSFEDYHRESSALWEKLALIRSRIVTGPPILREKILSIIKDCVLRTDLNKTDISEISRIRERMEKEIAVEDKSNVDLKTGQGGLVDVEFFTQAKILAHAGEYPDILASNTLDALLNLRKNGLIQKEIYETLDSGYRFLTNLEDRLRIMENRSIDRLPLSGDKLKGLAIRLGYGHDGDALIGDYLRIRNDIRNIYSSFLN
ncbi:MAG: bifunctional [glutamate--ammonia ligase]-adenylyl-L-tyrosine phosphorylase/[glutamate--ammonia-ligase] adenylyltransferase [Pseudomonadota bacterium]